MTGLSLPKAVMLRQALRILVVDDHADSLRVLALLLRRCGHVVWEAGTVDGALRLARDDAPDVLLSDLELPDGDGCELLRRLRAADSSVRGVALSGHTGEPYDGRCRDAGFEVLLVKGTGFERILEAVQGRPRRCLGGVPSPSRMRLDHVV